jgi:hypothetical protein
MSKGSNISAINTFEGGLVTDLHVGTSPANTVTHAMNMELISVGDNQYVFQNIKGNKKVVTFPEYTNTKENKKWPFIPLGVKVNNNIAYILLGAFDAAGKFEMGAIGTYPSPDWSALNAGSLLGTPGAAGISLLEDKFDFLHNFRNKGEITATAAFISNSFQFEKNRHIDIDIQGDFDGSVNIIFTDGLNNTSVINSRFSRIDSSRSVKLADRQGTKDSNTYSDEDWDRIALIQNNNYPVNVLGADGLDDFEVTEGGYLRGGGYRYYFKYTTQEGNTTELLYESPLIPISNKGLGLNKDQISDRLIRFTLKDLDSSYAGVRVYFTHFDGEDAATMDVFKINYIFTYGDTTSLVITHTGLEDVTPVDISEINVGFTPIDTVRTATIVNDRLALAGVSATISQDDINILTQAAFDMTLWERTKTITESYADPETAAKELGYWRGEVYEFAAVFMLLNKGLSPAFPITGMDNLGGEQAGFESPEQYFSYPIEANGFSNTLLINRKGLFRTSNTGVVYEPLPGGEGKRHVTYIEVNSSANKNNIPLQKIASGFFIVKRRRIKNVLMQGMAVPALKLPAKYPSLSEGMMKEQLGLSAGKRYVTFNYSGDKPVLGLNARYQAQKEKNGEASFNDEFDTVFVPQPAPIINVLTSEKAWFVTGGIGQSIFSPFYGETVDKDNVGTNKIHLGFYSCELDMNFSAIKGQLNGINPRIEMQGMLLNASPVGYTHTHLNAGLPTFKSKPNLIIRNAEKIAIDRGGRYPNNWVTFPSSNVRATIMESGRPSFSNNGFTAKIDRVYGFITDNVTSTSVDTVDPTQKITYTLPFTNPGNRDSTTIAASGSEVYSNSKVTVRDGGFFKTYIMPTSLMAQSYSNYLGIEVSLPMPVSESNIPAALFNYMPKLITAYTQLTNHSQVMLDSTGDAANRQFTSMGHLANVFRSATGRWKVPDIINIYKYDSNKPYHAVSNRTALKTDTVAVFRGDGFISRIFKKVTYKNGIAVSKSATAADASDFGVGLLAKIMSHIPTKDVPVNEQDDPGRGLFDVGQVVELVSYSNINADIRSTEIFSPEESLIHGGDRDFYPHKEDVFGDSRPDSSKYNHGYTGEENPVSYNRIQENSPSYNTEFPNRILLSERNKTQGFFNAFRDLKGFNYRDYGVELGPIIKLVAIKNVLLSIHPTGVLAIGVDDRTLVAEGSDVFVNTAQALSPVSKTISSMYGSSHAEAVVVTDTTVAGVDYNANAVWVFEGDKLTIISEFAVKTVLSKFKQRIEKINFTGGNPARNYKARVYTTFNHTKHTLYISYVAQDSLTKEQYHVGSISYNTVLQKWMSELTEGNKLSMFIGSSTYTTGFFSVPTIWEEDALIDPVTGKTVRCNSRGNANIGYEFEIVLNKEPALEKVLDNIRMITNKSIPFEIVYTTLGDENDAAINIWGSDPADKETTQKIITRNKSSKNHLRLGILDENAYYKNSGLYIEVGRLSQKDRRAIGYKRVRDKSIKVKFIYKGNDETFLQAIISMLSISYN